MDFKILVVDDSEDDLYFFKKALSKTGLRAEAVCNTDGFSVVSAIKENDFDCVFLDYHLGGITGLEILKNIRSNVIDIPVIMLTGQKDEKTIVALMKEGASDYLSKDSLSPEALRLSIENALRVYAIRKEKVLAEQALKISESRLAEAQHIAKLGNWEYDFKENQVFFSEEAYHILEYSRTDLPPSLLNFSKRIVQEDFLSIREAFQKLKGGASFDINFKYCSLDTTIKHLNAKGRIIIKNGEVQKILGTIQDTSILVNALNDKTKATIKSRATSIVLTIAIIIFLLSEAILDPLIDSLTASLLISLSFKGSIALVLKPVELFLEKLMQARIM